jgi:hypothetical protein
MGENNITAIPGYGVFSTFPPQFNNGQDVAAQAAAFYGPGGVKQSSFAFSAIDLANKGHPPAQIANACEMNAVYLASTGGRGGPDGTGDSYAGHVPPTKISDAIAVVDAGGGAAGGVGGVGAHTIEIVQPYYFEVSKDEDYWAAMVRLAQEVGWELIVDGNRIYYDSDFTLIRQKPAGVIDRDDATLLQWNYDWVNRHLASNFQLNLVCEKFEFHAGEVLQLTNFGPASTGSTAKLPGRWLIAEIARNAGDQFSTFSLVQPTAPKKEPAPQVVTKTVGGGGASGDANTGNASVDAIVNACKLLDSYRIPYPRPMVHYGGSNCQDPPSKSPGLDCSSSTSWVMHKAGAWSGGCDAIVSGDFASSWGEPGRGKFVTVWANGGHVFTEVNAPGVGHMQGNTSGGGDGFHWFPWGGNGQADAESGAFTPRHWPGT